MSKIQKRGMKLFKKQIWFMLLLGLMLFSVSADLPSPQASGNYYELNIVAGDYVNIAQLDRAVFVYNNLEYSVHIHEIDTTTVRISIQDVRNIVLNLKESKRIDLDNDSLDDLTISVESISNGVVRFYFKELLKPTIIEKPASTPSMPINPSIYPPGEETSSEIVEPGLSSSQKNLIIGMIFGFFVFLLLIIFISVIRTAKKRSAQKEHKKPHKLIKPKKIKLKKIKKKH